MNIWLAESGSTKTDWQCIDGPAAGTRVASPGLNPSYLDGHQISQELHAGLAGRIDAHAVISLHFYGAGCAGPGPRARMEEALQDYFPAAAIQIDHDLLAAGRGLWGTQAGLVGILGTGSHACYYDGAGIPDEAISLGYLLGDEGGGVSIGRELVRRHFYGLLPPSLAAPFASYLGMGRARLIEQLYRQPWPNRWLAGLAPFAWHNRTDPHMATLLAALFDDYVRLHVMPLSQRHPAAELACVGSIGHHFAAELAKALARAGGPTLVKSPVSPMEGLVRYHG